MEVSFPPGARVAYETGAREPRIHQQVWVLEGAIVVTVGDETHRLRAGDCLALVLDRPTTYHNSTEAGALRRRDRARARAEEMTCRTSTVTPRFRFDACIA